jgi:glycolate oxidase iron-sulfur subunit
VLTARFAFAAAERASFRSGSLLEDDSAILQHSDLLRLADQCVKCGFCLPHCPTFRLRRDEAESPRGRIALIQGLLSGELAAGARLDAHLGSCLQCRACEPVCPSLVEYGRLMDGARAERIAGLARWRRALLRALLGLISDPRSAVRLAWLAGLYRRLRLPRVAAALGLLRVPRLAVLDGLARQLRRPPPLGELAARPQPPERAVNASAPVSAPESTPVSAPVSASGRADRSVALFLGCVARALQPNTITAALAVLQRLGVAVQLADGQACCGAMYRHNGFPASADRLLERNQAAFGDATVVGVASACVAELRPAVAAVELCRFLVDTPWPADLRPEPLPETVVVHEPCSHRNQLRDTQAVYALLARIPDLRVEPLADNAFCCGAAGTYLLQHPRTAQTLAADKLRELLLRPAEQTPRWLATTNTGCAAHLAAQLRAAGLDIEVVHPVDLLARAIGARG